MDTQNSNAAEMNDQMALTKKEAEAEVTAPAVGDEGATAGAKPEVASEVKAEASRVGVMVVTEAEAGLMPLDPAQRMAIIKLSQGSSRVEAARAAGVTRTTLYRWLNQDVAFQAAFNTWQSDVINTAQAQLLASTHIALEAVMKAIRGGDARLAWKVLESQGVTARPRGGSTDVVELQRREGMERKKKEIADRREQNKIKVDELMSMDGL